MRALERKDKSFHIEIIVKLIRVNVQLFVLTSIESTGDYLVFHGVTEELQWSPGRKGKKANLVNWITANLNVSLFFRNACLS